MCLRWRTYAGSFGRVYMGMWRQTKVAIKLLAHPADVFVDGSGEPHGFLDDYDRHDALDVLRTKTSIKVSSAHHQEARGGRDAGVCLVCTRQEVLCSHAAHLKVIGMQNARALVLCACHSPVPASREETEAKAAAVLGAVRKEAAMIASLRHPNIVLFMGETSPCNQDTVLDKNLRAVSPGAVPAPSAA